MTLLIATISVAAALIAFLPAYFAGLQAIEDSMDELGGAFAREMSYAVQEFFADPLELAESLQISAKAGALTPWSPATNGPWVAAFFSYLRENEGSLTQINGMSYGTVYPVTGNLRFVLDQRGARVNLLLNNATDYLWVPIATNGTVDYASLRTMSGWLTTPRPLPASDLEWYQGDLHGYSNAQLELQFNLRDSNHNLMAYIGFVVLPTEINDFFSEFDLRPRSRAFCFDVRTGVILGRSWDENMTTTPAGVPSSRPVWERIQLLNIVNITEPLAARIVNDIGPQTLSFAAMPSDGDGLVFRLSSGVDAIHVTVIEVVGPQLRLRVVLALSAVDFQGELYDTQFRTLLIVFIVVALMIVVSFVIAHVLVKPFQRLEHRMHLSATLNDDDEGLSPSCISEVAAMQRSYMTLRSELVKIRSYLPDALLCQLREHDDGPWDDSVEESEGSIPRGSTAESQTQRSLQISVGNLSQGRWQESARSSTVNTATSAPIPSQISKDRYLNTSVGVAAKKVTVLMLNLQGFHSAVRTQGMESLGSIQGIIVGMVQSVLHLQKGVLEFFQGDHITVSFNAATAAPLHAQKAATVAVELARIFKENSQMGFCTIGISTGAAFVGNMGTVELKRFCIVGAVVPQAAALERLTKLYASKGVSVLIHAGMFPELVTFEYQPVGIVPLPALPNGRIIASLERQKQFKADEWMYQLQDNGQCVTGHPYDSMNRAYEALLAEDYACASEHCMAAKLRMAALDSQLVAKLNSGKRGSLGIPPMVGVEEAERMITTHERLSLGLFYNECTC